jgi:hypothetical protein
MQVAGAPSRSTAISAVTLNDGSMLSFDLANGTTDGKGGSMTSCMSRAYSSRAARARSRSINSTARLSTGLVYTVYLCGGLGAMRATSRSGLVTTGRRTVHTRYATTALGSVLLTVAGAPATSPGTVHWNSEPVGFNVQPIWNKAGQLGTHITTRTTSFSTIRRVVTHANVAINTVVQPARSWSTTRTKDYTFSGAGRYGGTTGLTQEWQRAR